MLCRIWYHLYNLKNLKNTLLVSNFSESNAPPWIFSSVDIYSSCLGTGCGLFQKVENRKIFNTVHLLHFLFFSFSSVWFFLIKVLKNLGEALHKDFYGTYISKLFLRKRPFNAYCAN